MLNLLLLLKIGAQIPIPFLEEGHWHPALFGGTIMPLAVPDGNAVVAGHAKLQPGTEQ